MGWIVPIRSDEFGSDAFLRWSCWACRCA